MKTPAQLGVRGALTVTLLALASACGRGAAAEEALVFTAIPDDDTTELRERFEPVADYLAGELGIPVRYVATSSYEASVEAFKNGDVQLAWFGGLTGAQARAAVPGSRAIAQGAVDPSFKSYFIAHRDTGLELDPDGAFPLGLEGRSFTFGSPSSTSGRLMPEHFLRAETGRAPEAFFGTPNHYSGSHDQTAVLVASGAFEAGALNYKTWERMVASGRVDPEAARVVWVTPEYADYNWTAHPDLERRFGEGLVERLQRALIEMRDPGLLAAVDRAEGLIRASNEDFAAVAELARQLGFLR